MILAQAVVDDDVGDRRDLRLDVLDAELRAAERPVRRRAEQRMAGRQTQAADRLVEAPGIEQHADGAGARAAGDRVCVELAQQRMIEPCCGDQAQWQVVIDDDGVDDLALIW